jgi:hypothetical protein
MSEFERIKQTVGNRNILMTSWFDEGQQTWRANAPAYAHLSDLMAEARITCASRKAAMDKLSSVLAKHFSGLES